MQFDRPRGFLSRCSPEVVVDHQNLGLQERAFPIDAKTFETLSAFADKVEAAVGVLLYDADDFGCTSYVSETLLNCAHYAEMAMLGEAFANHFFVARLENV